MKIGFLTGARSEYGIMRNVIQELVNDSNFEVSIIATGMHFLQRYGYTISEIRSDALARIINAPCYSEGQQEKVTDFTSLISVIYSVLQKDHFDCIYLIGDRLEAYASALAAHFLSIPVVHFAGGQITKGAVDNIYRYNISNLASLHLVTNVYAYDRLLSVPIIDNDAVKLVGSSAVDNICKYLKSPKDASLIDNRLTRNNYALITYHSQTIGNNQIPLCLRESIKAVLSLGLKVLLTYPNNDNGCDNIIQEIVKWKSDENVVIIPNLGVEKYYVAVDNAVLVIGNSSSGIIEVPYFAKYTINVGRRQEGRNAPSSVVSISDNPENVYNTVIDYISSQKPSPVNEKLFGTGHSVKKIKLALYNAFAQNSDI